MVCYRVDTITRTCITYQSWLLDAASPSFCTRRFVCHELNFVSIEMGSRFDRHERTYHIIHGVTNCLCRFGSVNSVCRSTNHDWLISTDDRLHASFYGVRVGQFAFYVQAFPRDMVQLKVSVSIFGCTWVPTIPTRTVPIPRCSSSCVSAHRDLITRLTMNQHPRQRPDVRVDMDLSSPFDRLSVE